MSQHQEPKPKQSINHHQPQPPSQHHTSVQGQVQSEAKQPVSQKHVEEAKSAKQAKLAQSPTKEIKQQQKAPPQQQHKPVETKIIAQVQKEQKLIESNKVEQSVKIIEPTEKKAHEERKIKQIPIQQHIQYFKKSKGCEIIHTHLGKIMQLLKLANKQSQSLHINLGVGQNKGKTNISFKLNLKNEITSKFSIVLQVKIKKKAQFKTMIESEINRALQSQHFSLYKLGQIKFTQTQKTLKIEILSPIFEQHVLKETIAFIQNMQAQQSKLQVSSQLAIKNSLKNQQTLQKKRFIKWIGQGLSSNTEIKGSKEVIKYFSQILAEFFPIFKVIRSGQVNLKLKSIANIDKLFQKLGINQLSEETPTLSAFINGIIKEYLHNQSLPWIADLIKRSILFTNTIPNERISIDLTANISHLHLEASLSSDACKELAEIVNTSINQVFS